MTLSEMRNVLQFIADNNLDIIHISDRVSIMIDDYLKPSDISFFFNQWKAFFTMYPYKQYDDCTMHVYRMISDYTISKYEARLNAKRERVMDETAIPCELMDETR